MKRRLVLALTALVCGLWVVPALCGAGEAAPEGGRTGRRERRQRDPEEMRRRMEEFRQRASERMRENLGCTAEEWKVIGPRVEAVQTSQRNLRFGGRGMFGMMGRGRRGPGGAVQGPGGTERRRPERREPETEIGKKTVALQEVLDKKDAKAADIKTALTALRAARKKAEQDLTAKRKSLREVLTQRQEATLVLMGILD